MVNSRDKGARGERLLRDLLNSLGFKTRRGQQFSGGTDSPDVIGLEGIHPECKFVERLNLWEAIAQAKRDAGEKVPTVFFKKSRSDWYAVVPVLRMDEFIEHWQKGKSE